MVHWHYTSRLDTIGAEQRERGKGISIGTSGLDRELQMPSLYGKVSHFKNVLNINARTVKRARCGPVKPSHLLRPLS